MKCATRLYARLALIGGALSLAAMQAAVADVIFQAGNQQFTNVNIAADIDAFSITGEIGNTGVLMTFQDMIGPDGLTNVEEHGQHGVAFVESFFDSQTNQHTGFTGLSLVAEPGTSWRAGDFALDLCSCSVSSTPMVTFIAFDQNGNALPAQTLALDVNGQSQFNFFTLNGESITKIDIITGTNPTGTKPFDTTQPLQDIKQVSLEVVPEPATVVLLGIGLVGLGLSRRKR